jgi:uncharacterized membrane protein (UPF0127 family)
MWILLALAFTIIAGAAARPTQAMDFEVCRLSLSRVADTPLGLEVELARNPAQWTQGLMGREHLAADRGMLFDFGVAQRVVMWMKDTRIPLDMLFFDAAGRCFQVVHDTRPMSTEYIPAREDARFVLELNAGAAQRLGLGPDARLATGDTSRCLGAVENGR